MNADISNIDVLVVVVDLFLRGVKQYPGRGGINLSISVTNYVGCIYGTVLSHDADNNSQDVSTLQVAVNNILSWGRGKGCMRDLRLCIVKQSDVS